MTQLISRMNLLVVDCAVSPTGDLVICCHTGPPDWGNGPAGKGRLFKISHADEQAALPVVTWAESETKTVIAMDRALDRSELADVLPKTRIESGHYLSAGFQLERMRPPYTVVGYQQAQPSRPVSVRTVRLSEDGRQVIIESQPRDASLNYAVSVPQQFDVAHNLSGLAVQWHGKSGAWNGWLPHPDFSAAKAFTVASAAHDELWSKIAQSGTLDLRAQLDLWNMLQPMTQPTSKLDYTPEPETVTLVFVSDSALQIEAAGATVRRVSDHETHLTVDGPRENHWQSFALNVDTPVSSLDVSFSTARDPRPRPIPTTRFLMPFATSAPPTISRPEIPEIAGGNWDAGQVLYNGKATCAKCHKLRGAGTTVGPDLDNLIHRDYASVLQDIVDPSARINPDAVGYNVLLDDGTLISGARAAETDDEIHIVPANGEVAKLKKANIREIRPMKESPMPKGIEKLLTTTELRDLMTFLLLREPAEPTP